MYKKSIKLFIVIISFIAILLVANNSFAVISISDTDPSASLSFAFGGRTDPWTGLWELLPYNVKRETAVGATFCMQKHQALRFTPAAAIELNGYSTNTVISHSELHSYSDGGVPDTYARQSVINNIKNELNDKLDDLGWGIAGLGTGDLERYGTGSYLYNEEGESAEIVAVSKPYAKTPDYVGQGKEIAKNNYLSYILSSGSYFNPITKFGLKKGNYAGTVSDTAGGKENAFLIQDAVWASLFNLPASDGINYRRNKPQIAVDLVKEAEDYEKYVPKLTSYNAGFEETKPKVIANRENNTYSVGPFKIYYPDDTRFSYIQEIYITDEAGNKIETDSLKLITATGKEYPASEETFFIEFDGSIGDNHDKINVKAEFAYLVLTYAEYERFIGTGTIGQMLGTIDSSSDTHEYKTNSYCTRYYLTGKLQEKIIGKYDPQSLFDVITVRRDWVEDYAKTYAEKDKLIDLRTELGGYVWVDNNEKAKESGYNGLYDDGEKRVPNITVKLYREDGKFIKETKTNEKGEYKFKDLKALKKYYVTFEYNGQYYEPTTYTSPYDTNNGWGKGTWQKNSNSTDIATERDEFNQVFGSIGSSPANYKNGRTFTKQELLDAKIIDEFGNLISESNKEMAQFVKDCRMTAHTGLDTGYDKYPIPDIFLIDNEVRVKNAYGSMYNMKEKAGKIIILFPDAYYINLGLHERKEVDIAVKKDIQKVDLEINGQKHTYTYDTLENKPNSDGTWEIGVRISDQYYNTNYTRELFKADYLYKVSSYGSEAERLGKTKADELNIYVTYKIMVKNQSTSIRTRIDELVDYYDPDYELAPERSYVEIKSTGKFQIGLNSNSIYGENTQTSIPGYDRVYITGLGKTGAASIYDDGKSNANGYYLNAGEMAYFYLTFKVKKDTINNEDWLRIDENVETGEIGVGKENIVELNGYSTIYADGTEVPNIGDVSGKVAGLIDRDSTPGNLNPNDVIKDGKVNYENFEDDTDKAPNIRIILYRDDEGNRVVTGSIWEDERTEQLKAYAIANGIKDEGETPINGVTTELVEIANNGEEFVWRRTESGPDTNTSPIINAIINGKTIVDDYTFEGDLAGAYVFKSFVPGKYVIRFTYGDTEKTIVPGLANAKSYNGQDYKSTVYQKGIEQNSEYDWKLNSTYIYGQEFEGALLTTVPTFKADASNNERVQLPNIKQEGWTAIDANSQKGYLYDFNALQGVTDVSSAKDIESRRNKVNSYSDKNVTNYKAEVLASHKTDYIPLNDKETLKKDLMNNTKMTAETGLMVFEVEYNRDKTEGQEVNNKTSYKVKDVNFGLQERPKAQLIMNKKVTNVKVTLADGSILFDSKGPASNVLWKNNTPYEVAYNGNKLDNSKYGTLEQIRNNISKNRGVINITMDEELMHGATITIDYEISVINASELDYKDNLFYYTGVPSSSAKVVKTSANKVMDYVANNLKFDAQVNKEWKEYSKDKLKSEGLINAKLLDNGGASDTYNTIIVTDALSEELYPTIYKDKINSDVTNTVSVPLVLTQLITSENRTKDLTFRNIVEIASTSNTVGRRMEYSVVGNQNPTLDPQELDSAMSETVYLLPPFGNGGIYIIISLITIVSAGIIVAAVFFIKRKVIAK